jgi:hypothetical protein
MQAVHFLKRAGIGFAAATLLAGGFYAGTAYAADPAFDQANDNIVKAIALLEDAKNPNRNPPFDGHRRHAIGLLRRAQSEIQKAKEAADRPPRDRDRDRDKDKGKGKGKGRDGHHGHR